MNFEAFWNQYPRKIGRPKAKAKFERLKPEQQAAAVMDIQARNEKCGWPPEKQFIPHPTTYLNQERWLDEWEPDMTEEQKKDLKRKQQDDEYARSKNFRDYDHLCQVNKIGRYA